MSNSTNNFVLPDRRKLTVAVLLSSLVTLTLPASAHEDHEPAKAADAVADSGSSACPDGDDHGMPCGPTCPCICCPGHLLRLAYFPGVPTVRSPMTGPVETVTADNLHPTDITDRIFHPPRA